MSDRQFWECRVDLSVARGNAQAVASARETLAQETDQARVAALEAEIRRHEASSSPLEIERAFSKLQKRRRHHQWAKRRRKQQKEERSARPSLSAAIDAWQQQSIAHARQQEERLQEAKQTRRQLKMKLATAQKQLQVFQRLQRLEQLLKQRRGDSSTTPSAFFSKPEVQEALKTLGTDIAQTKEALQSKADAKEKTPDAPISHKRWQDPFPAASALVSKRWAWDRYVVPPSTPYAFQVPQTFVDVPTPSSAAWAAYMAPRK